MATVVYDEDAAYFGACSMCGESRYVNITNEHWFYCPSHQITWCVGADLFSGWMYESLVEQLRAATLLDGFQIVMDNKVIGTFSAAERIPAIEKLFSRRTVTDS